MSHNSTPKKTAQEVREATQRLIQAQRDIYGSWLSVHHPKMASANALEMQKSDAVKIRKESVLKSLV
jgi:23S rRNA G2445 N2-methylase RlmL